MMTILLFFWIPPQLSGWDLLSHVKIVKGYDSFMGTEIDQPVFLEPLKTKEGEVITLEGFIIPLQQGSDQDYFVLSKFPYQSCFFCGAAGPETVVEVYSDHKFKFTDDRVRVTGELRLNSDSPLNLFFILENCEVEKMG